VYEVYLEKSAENDLKRLPPSVFQRIIPQLETLANKPRPSGCRQIAGSKNDWRIRIGDYRIIYEIDDKAFV
jgi:mRNA interferase RelE/StbE